MTLSGASCFIPLFYIGIGMASNKEALEHNYSEVVNLRTSSDNLPGRYLQTGKCYEADVVRVGCVM